MTNLELARLNAGLSQEELATKLGVSRQYINSCERGTRKLGAKKLKECADLLGVSPDSLLRMDLLTTLKGKGLPAALIIDIMHASTEDIHTVWEYLRYLHSEQA